MLNSNLKVSSQITKRVVLIDLTLFGVIWSRQPVKSVTGVPLTVTGIVNDLSDNQVSE